MSNYKYLYSIQDLYNLDSEEETARFVIDDRSNYPMEFVNFCINLIGDVIC